METNVAQCVDCDNKLGEQGRTCDACTERANPEFSDLPLLPPEFFASRKCEAEIAAASSQRSPAAKFAGVLALILILAGAAYLVIVLLPPPRASEPLEEEPVMASTSPSLQVLQDLDEEIGVDSEQDQPAEGGTLPATEEVPVKSGEAEVATVAEEAPQPDETQPAEIAGKLDPGMWVFSSQVYSVTSANSGKPAPQVADFPVGGNSQRRCISQPVAEIPVRSAFPLTPGAGCTVNSFIMSGGNYNASMMCGVAGQTQPALVELGGSYGSTNIDLTAHVTMDGPASGEGEAPASPYTVHATFRGSRTGDC